MIGVMQPESPHVNEAPTMRVPSGRAKERPGM